MFRLFGLFGLFRLFRKLQVVGMPNDIIGHVEGLNLLFVAVEELQAYLVAAVLARGVGYPRDIGVGEQVGVHFVLLHSTQQPVGCRPIDIVEPHAGNDEFGIEENHIAVRPLRCLTASLFDRFAV